jgi:dephospho-CoA kinase
MLLVALTGGIATGKSVASRILENLGCYIHRADETAHNLMEPGNPAWEKITARFGTRILDPNGTINRKKLGSIVFNSKKERDFLNGLIHPLVFAEKTKTIQKLIKEGKTKIFISEAALTLEAGFKDFFDKIIITHCDQNIQIRRLMDRDNIDRDQALQKIKSQMPLKEKLKHADYLINTSGTIRETIEQSEEVFRRLLWDYEAKTALGKKT